MSTSPVGVSPCQSVHFIATGSICNNQSVCVEYSAKCQIIVNLTGVSVSMCQCDNLSTPSQMDQFDVSQFYVEYKNFNAFKHQSVKLSHIIDILLDLLFPNKIRIHPDYLTFIPDIVVIR